MTNTRAFALAFAGLVSLTGAVAAQSGQGPGVLVTEDGSVTGGRDGSITISRGATGADTITDNSAAGGNANQPERAVPQGSGGGGSGNGAGQ